MVEIDKRNYDKGGRKNEKKEEQGRKTEFVKKGQGDPSGQGFDKRVSPRNPGSAIPAFSP
jgi:hypothetical protein